MMHLEQVLIEAATTQGIWVLLFVSLFLYTIKNNEKLVEKQDKREENYQKLLSDMTEKYSVVEDIRNSVDEIQKKVEMLSTEQKV
jgi:phosphopantetheine adenylyltransferase